MEYLILFFLFIFGLMVGSFLNVVIFLLESKRRIKNKGKRKEDLVILATSRRPESKSAGREDSGQARMTRENLGGRSFCPSCGHQLKTLDLFPVLSWISLRGKCRYCREKISIQYSLVELGTGLLFVISYLLFVIGGTGLSALSGYIATAILLIVNCLLLTIFVYDLKHKIIPDKVMLPAIFLSFGLIVLASLEQYANGYPFFSLNSILFTSIASAIGAGGFFYALAAVSDGKWMGGGDIKLAFFMGLLLGWPNILVGLFIGFLSGAVFGIALILNKKAKMQSEIPFGPFLIFGTWIALFWGNELIKLYLRTLGL